MKVRIWTDEMEAAARRPHFLPFLRACDGVEVGDSFQSFDGWMGKAPQGRIEVLAGTTWMRVTAGDGVPFTRGPHGCACTHPRMARLSGGDVGFLAYEAWKRAKSIHDFVATGARTISEIALCPPSHP